MSILKSLDKFALTLVTIGALNCGLIGLFQLDFIAFLLGGPSGIFSRLLNMLIGLAGLFCLTHLKKVD